MDGFITYQIVALLVAAIGAALGIWFRIEGKIRIAQMELDQKINLAATERIDLRKEIAEHKLSTIRDYASVQHLEKVEGRLIVALSALTEEVKQLREIWVTTAGMQRPMPMRSKKNDSMDS